jgi:hypothetical protein
MTDTSKTPGNDYPGNIDNGFRESHQDLPGHAADSAANAGQRESSRALAWKHPDLRQGVTEPGHFATVTANNDHFVGQVAFGGMDGPTRVTVTQLDAAGAAGTYTNMQDFDDRPQNAIAPDHQSRGSATPPNGSHNTNTPATRPRPAMKGSDALAIMKEHLANGR